MSPIQELRSMLFLPDDVASSPAGRGMSSEAGVRVQMLTLEERAALLDGVDMDALPQWARRSLALAAKQPA